MKCLFLWSLVWGLFVGGTCVGEDEFLKKITWQDNDAPVLMPRWCYTEMEDFQRIVQTYPSEEDFYEDLRKAWKSKDGSVRWWSLEFTKHFIATMPLTEDDYTLLKKIVLRDPKCFLVALECLQNSGKKELIPFFCKLLKDKRNHRKSVNRIAAALDALAVMREFLTKDDIDCILPLLQDTRVYERYLLRDLVDYYPLNVHAAEVLGKIGTPAAYTHETLFQDFIPQSMWKNYEEKKFAQFLRELDKAELSREKFWILAEKSGFHATSPFFNKDEWGEYKPELYVGTIASILLKFQPRNRLYQFLLVQSYMFYETADTKSARTLQGNAKLLDRYPSLKSFQKYLEWYQKSYPVNP